MTSFSVLLDENVERQVLTYLRTEGIEGEHVVDALTPGVEDADEIAPYAKECDHVLVTKDTDFLAMDVNDHAGVFFVVNHRQSAFDIAMSIVHVRDIVGDRDSLRGIIFLDEWS